MVDTRAGFWLQLFNLGLMIAFVIVALILAMPRTGRSRTLWIALWPASSLLPIVGVLLVSSEWSQRTSLITFALVPRRTRVLAAKLGAALSSPSSCLRRPGDCSGRHCRRRAERRRNLVAPAGDARPGPGLRDDLVDHGPRLRRRAPRLGAGDRPLLPAPGRLGARSARSRRSRAPRAGWTRHTRSPRWPTTLLSGTDGPAPEPRWRCGCSCPR